MSAIIQEPTTVETKSCDNEDGEETDHDPHYDPIISLPKVEVSTLEEDENVMLSLRAKVYRYDSNEDPPEWKERGTGNVKILHHKLNDTVRVVMRRDKTLKLCANHFITPFMILKPSAFCERAWVYSVKDFSDAMVKSELLAIKFVNVESALKWKEVFEEAKKIAAKHGSKKDATVEDKTISTDKGNENESKKQLKAEVTEKLSSLNIKQTEES